MSWFGHRVGVTAAFCSVLAAASLGGARAADWPLRGSVDPGFARWDGWQFGVQAGLANMRYRSWQQHQLARRFYSAQYHSRDEFAPSSWTTVAPDTTNGAVYGAFLGYNMQWDRLVVGFDMNYKYAVYVEHDCDRFNHKTVCHLGSIFNQLTIDARPR